MKVYLQLTPPDPSIYSQHQIH